jgi:acetyl esterase/lipase
MNHAILKLQAITVLAATFSIVAGMGATRGQQLTPGVVVVEENVVYGKGGDVDLKLDLARPAAKDGPFPALVFIHAGGWKIGSRAMYRREIERAAARGYVAVTVTYRLTDVQTDGTRRDTWGDGKPKYPWPAPIHDVKTAVRWLRANAARYKIDPEHIGATGSSAGGHLSLLLGLTKPKDGLEGDSGRGQPVISSGVQAVVNVFGPVDLTRMYPTTIELVRGGLRDFLGGRPDDAPARYGEASPLTYVSADAPPTLTIHGDKDVFVPLEQAKMLDDAMKKAGAQHTLIVVPGGDHGFLDLLGTRKPTAGVDDIADGAGMQRAMKQAYEFFDRTLKPVRPKP